MTHFDGCEAFLRTYRVGLYTSPPKLKKHGLRVSARRRLRRTVESEFLVGGRILIFGL